jgi:hypothetical protein
MSESGDVLVNFVSTLPCRCYRYCSSCLLLKLPQINAIKCSRMHKLTIQSAQTGYRITFSAHAHVCAVSLSTVSATDAVRPRQPRFDDGARRTSASGYSPVAELSSKPIFRSTLRNVSVGPGDRAVLKCRVDNLGTKTVGILASTIAVEHDQFSCNQSVLLITRPDVRTVFKFLPHTISEMFLHLTSGNYRVFITNLVSSIDLMAAVSDKFVCLHMIIYVLYKTINQSIVNILLIALVINHNSVKQVEPELCFTVPFSNRGYKLRIRKSSAYTVTDPKKL